MIKLSELLRAEVLIMKIPQESISFVFKKAPKSSYLWINEIDNCFQVVICRKGVNVYFSRRDEKA